LLIALFHELIDKNRVFDKKSTEIRWGEWQKIFTFIMNGPK